MPILRKCCCCFSLKTGGVILGWICAVSSFLALVLSLVAICNVDTLVKVIQEHAKENEFDDEKVKTYLQIFLGFYIGVTLVGLVSASLLIAGSVRRNRYLILPWLISTGINLLLALLINICQVVATMSQDVGSGFLAIFVLGVFYAIEVYLFLAIFSLFQQLREEEANNVGNAALIYKAPPSDGMPSYTGFA